MSETSDWRVLLDPARPTWPGVLIVGPGNVMIGVVAGEPQNFADSRDLADRMVAALRAASAVPTSPQGTPDRIAAALTIASQYGGIDGEHHKAWVIDQMVRALTGEDYAEWVRQRTGGRRPGDDGPDTYEWPQGIAP